MDSQSVSDARSFSENPLPNFVVAHLNAETVRFGQRRLLVHHLLEDLLLDPELFEELFAHLAAVRRAVRLQLRCVSPAEFSGRDLVAFDDRDRIG